MSVFLSFFYHLKPVSTRNLNASPSLCSLSGRLRGDRRGGRGPPGDELVALRLRHGLRRRGWTDARLPGGLHGPLHASR